eukprot:CAMPEP_0178468676 /NCGR_PEP_ID=MMETSP0689_2-20121128/53040_1 /TAXON_ID=160604 /ORGANISM="Amphidinium massartii, Strain CS-259" /LENGTH=42 /DNA_ID= /DNA_START= /DNA_END= /DNA_ORIENTATION=
MSAAAGEGLSPLAAARNDSCTSEPTCCVAIAEPMRKINWYRM